MLIALSIFITSCGKEKIEKDSESIEDSITLTETKYAETEAPTQGVYGQENFEEIKFENFQHLVFQNDMNISEQLVTLNGTLNLNENNLPSGDLSIASFDHKLNASLKIKEGKIFYQDEKTEMWIDPFNMEIIHQNSEELNFFTIASEMINSLEKGIQLTDNQKAVFSLYALGSTDQFLIARDKVKMQINLKAVSCNWYDHFIAGLIAAPIAVAAAAGCASLTAGCTVGGVLTFGGVAVPCAVLVPGCAAGAFFSVNGAYNYVLNNWLCDQITCSFAPPALCWSGNPSNNSVRLNWSAVSGADRYQIVQWFNGGWFPLGETSRTWSNINGMVPGATYYFGARTICGNTVGNDARWTTVFN